MDHRPDASPFLSLCPFCVCGYLLLHARFSVRNAIEVIRDSEWFFFFSCGLAWGQFISWQSGNYSFGSWISGFVRYFLASQGCQMDPWLSSKSFLFGAPSAPASPLSWGDCWQALLSWLVSELKLPA